MTTLLLWATLISLVVLAIFDPVDMMWGNFELDFEGFELFDQLESEDEFLLVTASMAAVGGLLLSKFERLSNYFRNAHLSPLSPPPKTHFS